jgi:Type II CAAX prenyl endopeptidase Rce1-like
MTIVVLVGAGLIAMDMRRARQDLRPVYFPLMLAESSVLAILFGLVIGTVTARLLGAANLLAAGAPTDLAQMSWTTRLMLSLGAGLYEELFFRVLMVSGLTALGLKVFGWSRRSAVLMAVLVSAFVFSAFHYIPPYGDKLQLASFTFRFFSGVAFSALYVVRGFGITAWTHALYDCFLLLL